MGIWETIVRYSKTYFPKISQFVSYNKEFQQEYLRTVRDGYFVGYSFVKSFVDVLWNNKDSIGINNYVVLWKVKYNEVQ